MLFIHSLVHSLSSSSDIQHMPPWNMPGPRLVGPTLDKPVEKMLLTDHYHIVSKPASKIPKPLKMEQPIAQKS